MNRVVNGAVVNGAVVTGAHLLVVAKAPVPGEAKTRLGAVVGLELAAELAAAALLDTLEVGAAAFPAGRRHLALTGDLPRAARGEEIRAGLAGWQVRPQRGVSFGERLAAAHADVAEAVGADAPVVQIGMDTPQVTEGALLAVGDALADADAALGVAEDGGWWALALRDPYAAAVLADVPMSTPHTARDTRLALERRGLSVADLPVLRDVDTDADADAVAAACGDRRFARTWAVRR